MNGMLPQNASDPSSGFNRASLRPLKRDPRSPIRLALCGVSLLLAWSGNSLHLFRPPDVVLPDLQRVLNLFLGVSAAICLLFASFLAHRNDPKSRLSGLGLVTSSLLLLLCVFDVYVLFFNFQTSGYGLRRAITHQNWA